MVARHSFPGMIFWSCQSDCSLPSQSRQMRYKLLSVPVIRVRIGDEEFRLFLTGL